MHRGGKKHPHSFTLLVSKVRDLLKQGFTHSDLHYIYQLFFFFLTFQDFCHLKKRETEIIYLRKLKRGSRPKEQTKTRLQYIAQTRKKRMRYYTPSIILRLSTVFVQWSHVNLPITTSHCFHVNSFLKQYKKSMNINSDSVFSILLQ